MRIGFTFTLITIVVFLILQRKQRTTFFSVTGSLVLAGVIAVVVIAGYRFADKRGYIPRAISSEVRDTVREIKEAGRSTAHDLRE